jgi:hypothetical protein
MKIKQLLCAAALMTASCHLYADVETVYDQTANTLVLDLNECHKPIARHVLMIENTEDYGDNKSLRGYADTIEHKLRSTYPNHKALTLSQIFIRPDTFITYPTLVTTFYDGTKTSPQDCIKIAVKDIQNFLNKEINPSLSKDTNVTYYELFEE